jgi:elongator complex protein 3
MAIFDAARSSPGWDPDRLMQILAQHPRDNKGYYSKIELVAGYRQLTEAGELPFEPRVMRRLQMKPIRTASGVAPVTVLTEPAGCPAHCVFCPDDVRMPKSYLPDEPGARRAAQCDFDPYLQVSTRIETFQAMGHTAEKVELLILGGTWSAYSRRYREWFVRRCLDAMNGEDSATLAEAQARNEAAAHRNVGLVIETRPDWIRPAEVLHLRQLGVTKVQLGLQSLDDRILALNKRGHDVAAARRALRLLRGAGFKLHVHWMPNLFGATPASDGEDFLRLWSDPGLRPDEIKIYPCSIIAGTELFDLWQAGRFQPYGEEELIALVADCKAAIPPYCRVNRVFRDIPSDDIVAGTKSSNLRQMVQVNMAARGLACHCIRCREVREAAVAGDGLHLTVYTYDTDGSQEQFLGLETAGGRLAGFLRLSLPAPDAAVAIPEIAGAAMIRELHVYGPALGIGAAATSGEAQHVGLGRRLVAEARSRARAAGRARLGVISAIGTRPYYEGLGFRRGELYMLCDL